MHCLQQIRGEEPASRWKPPGAYLSYSKKRTDAQTALLLAALIPEPDCATLAEELTPVSLGARVALHEYCGFTPGVIWDIDAFDQWGVELGKSPAERTAAALRSAADGRAVHDSSTQSLIDRYRVLRRI